MFNTCTVCRDKLGEYVNLVSITEEIDTNSLENGMFSITHTVL